MKRTLKILVGTISILIIAALVIPFLVDMNQFKPQIKAVIADAVNADIEFDSARLTILTGLGVKLENVQLKNTAAPFADTTLFKVDELVLRAALAPMLSGNFEGEVLIDGPEITMVTKGLSNNFASLAKAKKPTTIEKTSPQDHSEPDDIKPAPTPEEIAKREAMIENFKKRILVKAIKIDDAVFLMDHLEENGRVNAIKISDLDIEILDIGPGTNIKTKISTEVSYTEGGIAVKGPINLAFNLHASTEGSKFRVATYKGLLNFDSSSAEGLCYFALVKCIRIINAFNYLNEN